MAESVTLLCLGAAALLLLASALTDLASLTIPNRIPAGIAVLFLVAAVAGPLGWSAAGWHVAAGLAVFAVTVGLFAAGLFGGGDAKLMPAVALWMGPDAVIPFVVYTALAGGLLALVLLVVRRVPLPAAAVGLPWIARLHRRDGGIPYAVAIAAGALAAAGHAGLVRSIVG